jgi:hypothetical protein
MISNALFSSVCTGWGTPQKLFDELDSEFHFTLDTCAARIDALNVFFEPEGDNND